MAGYIMAREVYAKVVARVNILTAAEREALIKHLQEKTLGSALGEPPTREIFLAEHEDLKSIGAFDKVESLRGMF